MWHFKNIEKHLYHHAKWGYQNLLGKAIADPNILVITQHTELLVKLSVRASEQNCSRLWFFRLCDTKLKARGLEFKRASVSELKTELGVWGAHENLVLKKLPD